MKEDDRDFDTGNGSSKIIYVLLAALLIVLLGIGGYIAYSFLNTSGSGKMYTEYLDTAERYIDGQDYAQAILTLRKAINEDPSNYMAYYELARVYELQGDIDSGIHILELGHNRTGSRTLAQYLAELQARTEEANNDDLSFSQSTMADENKSTGDSGETYLDESLINKVSSSTSDGFARLYGNGEIRQKQSDGYVPIYYQNAGLTAYYRNTADNPNTITNDGRPVFNAYPEMIRFDKAVLVFKYFNQSISIKKLYSIAGKSLRVRQDNSENYYLEFPYSDITIRMYCDESGTVKADNTVWLYLPPHVLHEKAVYKGQVVDAVTGKGLAGVSCVFSGNGRQTVSTDRNGFFTAELDPGSWDLLLTKDGYMEVRDSFTLGAGEINSDNLYIMSGNLERGQIRIVLTWGDSPRDLDSHLEGTTDSGRSLHVYYHQRSAAHSNGEEIADLDVDDTTGYGPETITINDLQGVYDYYVVDFRSEGTMGQLGEAKVTVYMPDGSSQVVEVNSDCINTWAVLHIDHGNVSVINAADQ